MTMYDEMAKAAPQLVRGRVWCHTCGRTMRVDSADALGYGWPKCCGQTMSIDSPEERKAMKEKDNG